MSKIALQGQNISKDFIQGDTCIEVLKDLNIEIQHGSIVSVVGSSGCGKSTLLQILGLLDSNYTGEVYILGEKTSHLSDSDKRNIRLNKLGFVYQHHHLLKDFSARENIAMPGLIIGKNYDSELKRADEFLERLGMEKRRFHFPSQLSGGEQQRVAIARSLFNNPAIVLADEPTGNLDPDTAESVFNLFISTAKELETSVLLVTHNLELAKKGDKTIKIN
jgi:lipoprotein-releasing system ATP-binding protein